jgi:superfamily II DNA or RNA helicase
MPTAAGKTHCFSHLPDALELRTGKQMWFMVHRLELVEQAYKHLSRINPGRKVGIERERFHADKDCDLVVGSIPTLYRLGQRVQDINVEAVDSVVVDEIHHGISDSYGAVLKHFRVLKGDPGEDKNKLLVGFTATPNRGDNLGLEKILDEIVYSKGLREMIEDGWLASIRALRVSTSIDLSKVGVRRGDFITKQLEEAVNTPRRNELIVQKYLEMGEGKRGIAFTVDVQHSHDLALEFRRQGVEALPMSGNTPEEERKRILEAHEKGSVRMVISAGVMNEGVDVPWGEVGLMCRPTRSQLLYTQQVGRLTRIYPAPEDAVPVKTMATIIDFVDNSSRHVLCTMPSLFGLPAKTDLEGAKVIDVAAEVEAIQEKIKRALPDFVTLAELKSTIAAIDLLKPPAVPAEVEDISSLLWIKAGGAYEIILPEYILAVRENTLGQFDITRRSKGIEQPLHMGSLTLKDALQLAETAIPAQERILVSRASKWRALEVSEKQARALFKLDKSLASRFPDFKRFTDFVMGNYTRGDVSSMISNITRKKGMV